ncbi:Sir2 family NAD-dependent protein deacetylase [Bordetella sp. FB-8]|uniref:SIR2 family NAD-dependent protein deacylase n=1 Tax=Bordetella sp. FB-8 TaxID=1159870 RepID=UPI00037CCE02|nr:Sir2 family NAD-dependent protein deacetylase [Bordetella sp. FB-8]
MSIQEKAKLAAQWIQEASVIMIAAGAGMGVDSGLPDFRGAQGLWTKFPELKELNWGFQDIASPKAFREHPYLAWNFYAKRLDSYRRTTPHAGFEILLRWVALTTQGHRVFTSNIDGQFQKAGFASHQVLEVHGSIHRLQCLRPCRDDIWDADVYQPKFCVEGNLLCPPPTCPHCGGLARPHVLMFDDWGYIDGPTMQEVSAFNVWGFKHKNELLVIELGAGKTISTVRRYGERFAHRFIRINPNEWGVPSGKSRMGIQGGALSVLQQIDAELMALRDQR